MGCDASRTLKITAKWSILPHCVARPILDYVSVLVSSSTQRKISKLQPLQNRAIRIIRKLTGYISTLDMEKLHEELNLKWLGERRKKLMLSLMYKLSSEVEK